MGGQTSAQRAEESVCSSVGSRECSHIEHNYDEWAVIGMSADETGSAGEATFTFVAETIIREPESTASHKIMPVAEIKVDESLDFATILDWHVEGNFTCAQSSRKLSANNADMWLDDVSRKAAVPYNVLRAQSKKEPLFSKMPSKVAPTRLRRERSRSLVTQKRGR